MDWNAIGAIAEITGSLTVMVTVIYLAIQIRQSSKSAKSASTNQTRAAIVEVLGAISSNTDTLRTYAQGLNDRQALDLQERIRFDLLIFQTLRVTEIIFLEYREGLVTEEIWQSQWRGEQSVLTSPGGRESWERQKTFVSAGFRDWLDLHLDDR